MAYSSQGRAGFHPGASLCPFGDAVGSFWGRMQLAAEPPRPALLLPEQLSSLACKGNQSAAPALLWAQTRGPGRRHTDPRAAQSPVEKQQAVTISDGAAPLA